jgi:regulator of sigma E protease
MGLILFFIVLLVLVLVHEFGHFWTAKKFGIRVDEFGFGFPPKAVTLFKKGETEYTLNWLPIGGFVRIFGENPDAENTTGLDSARSFVNKPRWQQAIVLSAGVIANFILAWLLFSYGFMSGLPTSVGYELPGSTLTDVHLTVVSVAPDSPAAVAGLKAGDKITEVTSLSGKPDIMNEVLTDVNPQTLKSFIIAHGDKELKINYLRGDKPTIISLTPDTSKGSPTIGISMDQVGIAKLSFFSALRQGAGITWFTIKNTVIGLYNLIAQAIMGHASLEGVAGPVGMVGIVGDAYKLGFSFVISFAALISVNLGVINLLPFPALDGGRLFFLLIEKIKGSRINPKYFNIANTIGFSLLMLLMVVVTYHDIVKLF